MTISEARTHHTASLPVGMPVALRLVARGTCTFTVCCILSILTLGDVVASSLPYALVCRIRRRRDTQSAFRRSCHVAAAMELSILVGLPAMDWLQRWQCL